MTLGLVFSSPVLTIRTPSGRSGASPQARFKSVLHPCFIVKEGVKDILVTAGTEVVDA